MKPRFAIALLLTVTIVPFAEAANFTERAFRLFEADPEPPSVLEGGSRCTAGEGECDTPDPGKQVDVDAETANPTASAAPAAAPASTPVPAARTSRYALPLLGTYRKTMEIEEEINRACSRFYVPRALARAVCMYESGGDDRLTSGAGARGYFQVMPSTFRLMKVATNIEAGVKYLGLLLTEFGREDDALAAYNGGPGRVKKGRPMPIESLQYVVGVGIYRTLLTREEDAIREEASHLDLLRVSAGETWESVSAKIGVPVLDLRLYNAYLATRPLRAGAIVAYPRPGSLRFLAADFAGTQAGTSYETRRGDNYLLLAFAFDVDLDTFRKENQLWRVQAPFEGMRLIVPMRSRPREGGADLIAALTGGRGSLIEVSPGLPAPGSRAAMAPDPAADPAAAGRALPAAPSLATSAIVHKVRPGDTLHAIATLYGVSVDSLRKANKLRRSRLRVGQVLTIPAV